MKRKITAAFNLLGNKRILTRIVSLALTLLLIFYAIPTVIYAELAEAFPSDSSSDATQVAPSDIKINEVLYEDEARREESAKHFRLSDGSYIAAQYDVPVHTLSQDGKWEDIDNSLADVGNEYSSKNARIKFSKKTVGNGTLFALHDGNTKLTLSLMGANKGVTGTVTNGMDAEDDTELQKMMNLEKLSSSITYEEILDGVDLEYVVRSLNVKENIIVKKKKDSYSYSFELSLNNLTAELNEAGDVVILAESGEQKYVIPAPVVFDSAGSYAPDEYAFYTLFDNGNKKYILTVEVNPTWMNAEEREFPITVDPTVSAVKSYYIDTYIDKDNPIKNYSSNSIIKVTDSCYGYWKTTALPALPTGSYITKAEINMKAQALYSFGTIAVHRVNTNWSSSITWNTHNQASEGVINPLIVDYVGTATNRTWDITVIAREWYTGNNYGLALKTAPGAVFNARFHSSEASSASNRPTFSVTYLDMKGLEDYWSYSSHNAGIAGAGSVNLANGQLTFAIPTLTTTDSLFGYTATLVYNSALGNSDFAYTYDETPFESSVLAHGYKLNLSETILKSANSEYYLHSDADGTVHEYVATETEGVYSDSDGLQKVLTVLSNGNISITDDTKVTRIFTKMASGSVSSTEDGWYLTSISDVNANELRFNYDANLRISSVSVIPITSTEIVFLEFYYNDAGKLKMIYNSTSRDAVVFKYSNSSAGATSATASNYLREVVYAKGTDAVTLNNWNTFISSGTANNIIIVGSAEYVYNSLGLLISVKDTTVSNRQQILTYSWSNGKVASISHSVNSSTGQVVSFEYGIGHTDVKTTGNDEVLSTEDDISTRYVFDNYGRAVSSYSSSVSGTEIYGAVTGEYETQENVKNNISEKTVLGGSATNYILNGSFDSWTTTTKPAYWTLGGTATRLNGKNELAIKLEASQSGSAYQDVYLGEGDYTLAFTYRNSKADAVSASVSVTSVSGSSVSHSKAMSLNDENFSVGTVFSTTFTVPSGGDTVRILISASSSANQSVLSYLYIDEIVLQNGIGAANYSMVSYGHFDAGVVESGNTVALSTFWTTESGTAPTIQNDSTGFGNALRINGDFDEEKYVKQRIYSSPAGTGDVPGSITVSGFAKASGTIMSDKSKFRIRVDISYYQGAGVSDIVKSHYIDFLPDVDGWQFALDTIETIGETVRNYDSEGNVTSVQYYNQVSAIDVICEYSEQTGYALFDNVAVIDSSDTDVTRYYYYSNGLVAKIAGAFYEEYYEYSEDRFLTRIANNRGEMVVYGYFNELLYNETYYTYIDTASGAIVYPYTGRLAGEAGYVDPDSLITKTPISRTQYSYNTYGLLTAEESYAVSADLSILNGTKSVSSAYQYDVTAGSHIFGALTVITNSAGMSYRYFYDQADGKLLTEINVANGNGLSYTYDERDRLISVLPCNYATTGRLTVYNDEERVNYTYDTAGRLTGIATASTSYTLSYNTFGNQSGIKVGSTTLASYEYNQNNGKLNTVNYGNGFSEEYVYNELENLSEIWYNYADGTREKAYSYEYTGAGQLYRFNDHKSGEYYQYSYDFNGRLISLVKYGEETAKHETSLKANYNDKGQLSQAVYLIQDGTANSTDYLRLNTQYTYDTEGRVEKFRSYGIATDGSVNYVYDKLGRLESISNSHTQTTGSRTFSSSVSYTYEETSENTTARVKSYTTTVNGTSTTVSYMYGNNGYIIREDYTAGTSATVYTHYQYDNLGQLIREDNERLNRTYLYTYDDSGNILTKKEYYLTAVATTPSEADLISSNTYTYGNANWRDQLTSYNGTAITYDEVGNPISYYNGTAYSFTWEGRQLIQANVGIDVYTFTYNDEGIRTSKTKNGVTTVYHLNGSRIIAEETGGDITVYIYDDLGSPIGFQHRNATYAAGVWDVFWYEKNLQGDITAVYNNAGTKLVSYVYDAWGNTTTSYHNGGNSSYAKYNPFTYRGYYYDFDLGLYYLNSRYYDSTTCRFVNADDFLLVIATLMDLTDKNLYSYCDNNSIMRVDYGGAFWDYVLDFGFLAWSAYDVYKDPSDWKNWAALGVDALFAVVPFVPSGVGQVVKIGNGVDNALDVAKAINKAEDVKDATKLAIIGRKKARVKQTASLITTSVSVFVAFKKYDDLAKGVKKVLQNGATLVQNIGWIFGKLRKGYTIIDIGMPTYVKLRGFYYGSEKIILRLWQTRNLWKLPINYYS